MEFDKTPYIAIEKRLDLTAYIFDGFGHSRLRNDRRGCHTLSTLKYGKGSAENKL